MKKSHRTLPLAALLFCAVVAAPRAGRPEADPEAVMKGWTRVATEHFVFRYSPKASPWVDPVVRESEGEMLRLMSFLGVLEAAPIEVRIARSWDEMKRIKPGEPPPPWATGIAMRGARGIVLSLTPPGGGDLVALRELFLHEVVHILLWDATGRSDLPLWFSEGAAIHLSGELGFERTKLLLGAALRSQLLPIDAIDVRYPEGRRDVDLAYAQSADLVRFIVKRYDRDGDLVGELLARLKRGDQFDAALASLCRRSLAQVEGEWHASLSLQYKWVPSLTGGGALWGGITLLLLAAWMRRKKKAKETIRRMEIEEEFFKSEGTGATDVMIDIKDSGSAPQKSEDRTKVFYDGRYHTLH